MASGPSDVCDRVRAACAWVADRARTVRVDVGAIRPYAAGLPDAPPAAGTGPPLESGLGRREDRIAFVVCLNAINFGSGWWPTIRKRPGMSGFFTIATALAERFREAGPWSAGRLRRLSPRDVATALGQDAGHPLMADFAAALRDVGERLDRDHAGSFEVLVAAASGSAPQLVDLLAAGRRSPTSRPMGEARSRSTSAPSSFPSTSPVRASSTSTGSIG